MVFHKEWRNFDFGKNIVEFDRAKTGEPIVINYSKDETLVAYLEHLRSEKRELSPYLICHPTNHGWVPYSHFRSMWAKALEGAGYKKGTYKYKEIRHLANTRLKDAWITADKRRAMMGHKSIAANEGYTRPTGLDTLDPGRALSEFGPDKF